MTEKEKEGFKFLEDEPAMPKFYIPVGDENGNVVFAECAGMPTNGAVVITSNKKLLDILKEDDDKERREDVNSL